MQRYTGRLKFFDENKNYGFIIMDADGSDIFGIYKKGDVFVTFFKYNNFEYSAFRRYFEGQYSERVPQECKDGQYHKIFLHLHELYRTL